MTQLEQVRAEVERQYKALNEQYLKTRSAQVEGMMDALDHIESFIDSLEKEPHYTKRNELFEKCVANVDTETMKEVSDDVDRMLEKENRGNFPKSNTNSPKIKGIESINGFHIGDKVRLKDGDGRPHIIKSFEIDGFHGWFCEVNFEDKTSTMLDNISILEQKELDEAAEEEAKKFGNEYFPYRRWLSQCFKAGAKWMAEQGWHEEAKIKGSNDVVWLNYGVELPIDLAKFFKDGDKVIVQIRKK